MNIIKPSVKFYGAVPTDYKQALTFMELCARTCYKSEDKITLESAEPLIRRLIKVEHLAMIEHSNFVVRSKEPDYFPFELQGMCGNYLKVFSDHEYWYVGGNLTAWFQRANILGWDNTIFRVFGRKYADLFDVALIEPVDTEWEVCPHDKIPEKLHRYSAKFVCDRGVSHELVRHRPASMDWCSELFDSTIDIYKQFDGSVAQESTRYVNYSNTGMEFIEPWWWEDEQSNYLKETFRKSCETSERNYNDFIAFGRKPQAARALLTNALKTEVVITADLDEWEHIIKLRCSPAAQPDCQRVVKQLRSDMIQWGLAV